VGGRRVELGRNAKEGGGMGELRPSTGFPEKSPKSRMKKTAGRKEMQTRQGEKGK